MDELTSKRIRELKKEAYEKAIESLTGYKFMMTGYHCAIWVYLNQIDVEKEPNPFRPLVECARSMQARDQRQLDLIEQSIPSESRE